jgi:hypothetical protein
MFGEWNFSGGWISEVCDPGEFSSDGPPWFSLFEVNGCELASFWYQYKFLKRLSSVKHH